MKNHNEQIKREVLLDSLFYTYGKEKLLNWCRSLNFFRFYKSHPYPDDLRPDRFIALTSFENEKELATLFDLLQIRVKNEEEEALNSKEISSVFSGDAEVFSIYCYVEVNKILKTLLLEVSGTERDQFSLDDTTFQRAKKIDDFLSTLNIEFINSPYNDDYCLTPEFYSEIWR